MINTGLERLFSVSYNFLFAIGASKTILMGITYYFAGSGIFMSLQSVLSSFALML